MTITDQIKILNRKIMQNEAHYDLDRKAAKIKINCNADCLLITWTNMNI